MGGVKGNSRFTRVGDPARASRAHRLKMNYCSLAKSEMHCRVFLLMSLVLSGVSTNREGGPI
jgi:hypothetical protein